MRPVADKGQDVCEVLSWFDAGRLSGDNEAEEVGMFNRPGRRAGHQPGRPTAGNMSELLLRGSVINVKPTILSEGHDQLVGLIEEVDHTLSHRFRQGQMLQLLGAVFDLLKDGQGVLSTQLKSLRDSQSSILSLPFNLIDGLDTFNEEAGERVVALKRLMVSGHASGNRPKACPIHLQRVPRQCVHNLDKHPPEESQMCPIVTCPSQARQARFSLR